jgi:hypothetical protein
MTDRFAGLDYDGERFKGRRLGTLWYSENRAGGDVTLSPLFEELGNMERLDALGDMIGLLQREYDAALAEKWPKKM